MDGMNDYSMRENPAVERSLSEGEGTDRYNCDDSEKSKDINVTFLKSIWHKDGQRNVTKSPLLENHENLVQQQTLTQRKQSKKSMERISRERKKKPSSRFSCSNYFRDKDRRCFPPDLSDDDAYSEDDENKIENNIYLGGYRDGMRTTQVGVNNAKNDKTYDARNDKIIDNGELQRPRTFMRGQNTVILRTWRGQGTPREVMENRISLMQSQVNDTHETDMDMTDLVTDDAGYSTEDTNTTKSETGSGTNASDISEVEKQNNLSDEEGRSFSLSIGIPRSTNNTRFTTSYEGTSVRSKINGRPLSTERQNSPAYGMGRTNNYHTDRYSSNSTDNVYYPPNRDTSFHDGHDGRDPTNYELDLPNDCTESRVSPYSPSFDDHNHHYNCRHLSPAHSPTCSYRHAHSPTCHHRHAHSPTCQHHHAHSSTCHHRHSHSLNCQQHHGHSLNCHHHHDHFYDDNVCHHGAHINYEDDEDYYQSDHTHYHRLHQPHCQHQHIARGGSLNRYEDDLEKAEADKMLESRMLPPPSVNLSADQDRDADKHTSKPLEMNFSQSLAKDEEKSYDKETRHSHTSSSSCSWESPSSTPVNGLKFLPCLRQPLLHKGCGNCRNCKYNRTLDMMQGLVDSIDREIHDVIPDGNCMFRSIVDQLRMQGELDWTSMRLRTRAVNYLKENPSQEDGSHLEEFLTADGETWNGYLNRMSKDAEWGDNIILRGLAEVIGRKICIISAFGDLHNQTTFAPSKQKETDQSEDVFLGHIDDQHYVSLRKSDWRDTWYKNANTVYHGKEGSIKKRYDSNDIAKALECSELSSNVDEYSGVPLGHLTFTIRRLLPGRFFMTFAKELGKQMIDSLSEKGTKCILYGSLAEGLTASLTKGTYLTVLNKAPPKEKQMKVPHTAIFIDQDEVVDKLELDSVRAYHQIEMHYEIVQRGYLRLHFPSFAKENPDKVKKVDNYMYLLNKPYKDSKGSVRVFMCKEWPAFLISSWMDRKRPSGWPSVELSEEILSQFLIIAPFASPQSTDPEIEWQFCFAKQEYLLAMSLNTNQKYCFHVFQNLLRFHLGDRRLKRYYLKNIFFRALEKIPVEHWNTNPGACIMYLIDRTIEALDTKHLPQYFVPNSNLIGLLSKENCQSLSTKLRAIRQYPITSTILVAEAYDLNTSGIADIVIEDIPKYKKHRDITFEVYIPSYIKDIQQQIIFAAYWVAAKKFMEAFEEISQGSIFTIIPFPDFLHLTLSRIDNTIQWWFCFFLDFFHKTRALHERFGHIEGVFLSQIISNTDDSGVFWCIRIPFPLLQSISQSEIQGKQFDLSIQIKFLRVLCTELTRQFVYDHAVFYSRILVQKMKEYIKECSNEESSTSSSDTTDDVTESTRNDERDLESMRTALKSARKKCNYLKEQTVNILHITLYHDYMNMFFRYQLLGQTELFTEHVQDLESVCDVIATTAAYKDLASVWCALGSEQKYNETMDKSSNLTMSQDYTCV